MFIIQFLTAVSAINCVFLELVFTGRLLYWPRWLLYVLPFLHKKIVSRFMVWVIFEILLNPCSFLPIQIAFSRALFEVTALLINFSVISKSILFLQKIFQLTDSCLRVYNFEINFLRWILEPQFFVASNFVDYTEGVWCFDISWMIPSFLSRGVF